MRHRRPAVRRVTVALAALLAASVLTDPAQAGAPGSMPLSEFLSRANRIPQNAMALVHPQMRPVRREFEAAFGAVIQEQRAAREAGQAPRTCMPNRVNLNPRTLLEQLNAVPAARRNITITQAVREWAAREYPCPD